VSTSRRKSQCYKNAQAISSLHEVAGTEVACNDYGEQQSIQHGRVKSTVHKECGVAVFIEHSR
jgi:hypothetical protein